MTITTVGLDLAKNVFQVHGVDERGHVVPRKQMNRGTIGSERIANANEYRL
jgi:transposase